MLNFKRGWGLGILGHLVYFDNTQFACLRLFNFIIYAGAKHNRIHMIPRRTSARVKILGKYLLLQLNN